MTKQSDSLNSTPATVPLPPELLTEIVTLLETAKFDCGGSDDYAPCNPSILDTDNLAKQILLKCHQSEAARIKQLELGKKLSMESDNRIEQAIGKVLGYPAYKDDQKNFPNATESNGVCVGDHVAESLVMELVDRFKAIRADQNKKIGEWGNEPCPHRNNDFPFPKAVPSELQMPKRECRDCWQEKSGVAKLQKGDF